MTTALDKARQQARQMGIASRKRQVRDAAKFYDRARDLAPVYPGNLTDDLLTVHNDIGADFTGHILLKLARALKYHRANPLGRSTMATSICIVMVGEAANLRRQLSREAA